jgi:hypothetical protein
MPKTLIPHTIPHAKNLFQISRATTPKAPQVKPIAGDPGPRIQTKTRHFLGTGF